MTTSPKSFRTSVPYIYYPAAKVAYNSHIRAQSAKRFTLSSHICVHPLSQVFDKLSQMNVLGVNNGSPKQRKRSRASKDVKVVYISSPMKVQTSASKFRALVQELTGRDSDAERFMETNGGDHLQNVHEFSHEQQLKPAADHHHHVFPHHQIPFSNLIYDFPNCSDSLFDTFAGHFELDVFRSFDHV